MFSFLVVYKIVICIKLAEIRESDPLEPLNSGSVGKDASAAV